MNNRKPLIAAITASLAIVIAGAVISAGALTPTSANTVQAETDGHTLQDCQERRANPQPLTRAQREWLKTCVEALTTASPSASPTASPSSSPTAGPTASPSHSTSPSPTASPSASPTPSPTVSPTPSPTPTPPAAGCMPTPSACGYPDATNTGVPPGTPLTVVNGDFNITTPGVYTNRDVIGCVNIRASNVTIRNFRIRGDCWYAILTTINPNGVTGLIIEDTEIVLSATKLGSYGICCSNYTMNRVWIHGSPNGNTGADCVYVNSNVIVQNTYCEVGPAGPGDCYGNTSCTAAHSDGMTSDGGNNVKLIHNTIRNPNRQTSAILISTNSGLITNTEIRDGLYAGGGYTVYCGTDSGGVDPGTTFNNNRIARDWNGPQPGYYPNGGWFGPTIHCGGLGTGNVWDDTGLPLP